MINELIKQLCDKQEELVRYADSISAGKFTTSDGSRLVHTESHYRIKANGITTAIIMACRIRDKKTT